MRSKLFLTTNMLYEQRITRALKNRVPVVNVSDKIHRIPLSSGKHDHHHCGLDHHSCGGDAEAGDPHVWLSPVNCALMAERIADELSRIAPAYKAEFRERAAAFGMKMRKIHENTLKSLAPFKGRSFFVYHPAFGYFARLYGLEQHAIELGGREATPARMASVIREARKAGVKVVFVQKQFNPASAKALANAIKGEVVELDPLAADVGKNFSDLCGALLKGFGKK
jgi:zinc transport system substrate-binding protein